MYILFPSQMSRPRLGRHALEVESKVLGINASERRAHHHSCNPERLVVNVNTPMQVPKGRSSLSQSVKGVKQREAFSIGCLKLA
jgi:hypothetical protein